MNNTIASQLKKLPDMPGIYLFSNKDKELIYVGKATSLRSRVRSYFRGARTPRPIEEMIHEVASVKWKETDSVLESIILEANYIKEFLPKYNVLGKDDRSWNYIVITRDEYPVVTTFRQHQYKKLKKEQSGELRDYQYVFGPFPGLNTKATMKLLRKMFLFSDCQKKKKSESGKPCFYHQIGQCLGVCTGDISPAAYKKEVIKPLVMFLKGNKKRLIINLRKRMEKAAMDEKFELAARLRDQLGSLERIHDIALLNKSFVDDPVKYVQEHVTRIEGYDISNLGKTGKVGSMVVFDESGPITSEYKKFKIKTVVGQSDVDCLEEVLRRRLRHDKWPLPTLFLIDGGAPQVNRTKRILRELDIKIPVVGIAKGPDRKKNEFIMGTTNRDVIKWVSVHEPLLVQVRDEAHRFAISFQRSLRKIK